MSVNEIAFNNVIRMKNERVPSLTFDARSYILVHCQSLSAHDKASKHRNNCSEKKNAKTAENLSLSANKVIQENVVDLR